MIHSSRRAFHFLRLLFLVLVLSFNPASAAERNPAPDGRVDLWFFWTETCPYCLRALPFVKQLSDQRPWLVVHSHRVTASASELELFAREVAGAGGTVKGVPTFVFCKTVRVGFSSAETTGADLAAQLDRCHEERLGARPGAPGRAADLNLPLFGGVNAGTLSLPLATLAIATLDAFNPCALFVLMFLLSLLVHSRNRLRMVVIGGVFVAVSGLLHFTFMAAWLNLLLVFENLGWITVVAGTVAIAAAALNIKDFFRPGRGPSLSMTAGARSSLFARMRRLVMADQLPMMLAGTITLAVAANSFELLCTSGFPLIYTRTLTLHPGLPVGAYYLFLALYNVVYILFLAIIVAVFAWTLGSRKLSEREGRALKLLSGLMMLELGLAMVLAPDLLSSAWIGLLLLTMAVIVTAAFVWAEGAIAHRASP